MTPSPGEALIDLRERVAKAHYNAWLTTNRASLAGAWRTCEWNELPAEIKEEKRKEADAAISCVLEAMREPSEEMVQAVCTEPWFGHPEARPESIARWEVGRRKDARNKWRLMLSAFARTVGR